VAFLEIRCPACQHTDVIKQGITAQGNQRYRCKQPSCPHQTFLVEYRHQGRIPEVKQQILEMTLKGSGSRDIARVLHISSNTSTNEPSNTGIQARFVLKSIKWKKRKSMRYGVLLGRKANNDGFVMPLIIKLE
jgi:transposase-like protein